MYSAIAGAVMWWSRYSICGSECGGALLIPAFSGPEMSISRRGISASLLRRRHQLRWISTDASGVACLCMREAEIVAHRLQPGDRRVWIILRADNKGSRNAEHCIGIDVLVVTEIQRGDQLP